MVLYFIRDFTFSLLDCKILDFNIRWLDLTYKEWSIEIMFPTPLFIEELRGFDYFTSSFIVNLIQIVKGLFPFIFLYAVLFFFIILKPLAGMSKTLKFVWDYLAKIFHGAFFI